MRFSGFKALVGEHSSKQSGDAAEDAALRHLQQAGLRLLERNYRTPGRGGGEIDLIMRAPDGTWCLSRCAHATVPIMAARPPASALSSAGASCLRRGIT